MNIDGDAPIKDLDPDESMNRPGEPKHNPLSGGAGNDTEPANDPSSDH